MAGFVQFSFSVDKKEYQQYIKNCAVLVGRLRRNDKIIQERSSVILKQQLIGNLTSQKFASSYSDYSARYAIWKGAYGRISRGNAFWQLYGDLLKAIQIKKTYWNGKISTFVGIPPGIYDSGGKSWFGKGDKGKPKEILMYAIVMEKGGDYGSAGYHPPRPLFEPTEREFAFSSNRMRIMNQSAFNIIGAWRK